MYFIDVQGTLIDDIDKKPINGAIEFIDRLNCSNINYMIVTNSTKMESSDFLNYLNSLGFNIPRNRYLDPLMILENSLESQNILAFGVDSFLKVLINRGYMISSENPDAILLGVKHDYSHLEYSEIIEKLLSNSKIKLFGMHGTSIYSKNGMRFVGVGSILEMMKFATGRNYKVIGKPSDIFYKKALKMLNISNFSEVTIVSDDLKGDLKGAKDLGMKTVFVLSGKIKNVKEVLPFSDENREPDFIFDNVQEFMNKFISPC